MTGSIARRENRQYSSKRMSFGNWRWCMWNVHQKSTERALTHQPDRTNLDSNFRILNLVTEKGDTIGIQVGLSIYECRTSSTSASSVTVGSDILAERD